MENKELQRIGSYLISTFVLLAIVVQSMIPLGFMPSFSTAGNAIVICTSHGTKTIYVDENNQPVEQKTLSDTCPYSITFLDSFSFSTAILTSAVFLTQAVVFALSMDEAQNTPRKSYSSQAPPIHTL